MKAEYSAVCEPYSKLTAFSRVEVFQPKSLFFKDFISTGNNYILMMMMITFLAEDRLFFPQSFWPWNIFCQGEMTIRFSTSFYLVLGRGAFSPWSTWHLVPLPSPFIRVPYEPGKFSTLNKWWCSVSSSSFYILFFSSGIFGSMEVSWRKRSSWATRKQ